jgi:hypothetical protein
MVLRARTTYIRFTVSAGLSWLAGAWQGTEPDRPRHHSLNHKKIESGPGITLKVLRGLSCAVRPHHKEDVRRSFQGPAENDRPSCFKVFHKPGVGSPRWLVFK